MKNKGPVHVINAFFFFFFSFSFFHFAQAHKKSCSGGEEGNHGSLIDPMPHRRYNINCDLL